jgi:hypothetical protein
MADSCSARARALTTVGELAGVWAEAVAASNAMDNNTFKRIIWRAQTTAQEKDCIRCAAWIKEERTIEHTKERQEKLL